MSEATALEKTTSLPPEAVSEVALEQQRFELDQRKAAVYAKSSLVPKEYANNIGNVLIAVNMANRMGADPLMVMQNLYIVHGKPGWSATFLIACFNTCGRFSAIKYRFEGDPASDEYGCIAYCTETATGEVIEGTKITRLMAKKEGWATKNGSKWQTMEDQMFRYRAATFFIRATAPEIGMGLLTKDEIEDMSPVNGSAVAEKAGLAGLKSRLNVVDETGGGVPAAEDVVDGQVIDETEPDVAHTDAVVEPEAKTPNEGSAIEGETQKAESSLIDLRTAAGDLYATLTGDRLTEADTFLDGKSVRSLDRIRVTEFLEKFQ